MHLFICFRDDNLFIVLLSRAYDYFRKWFWIIYYLKILWRAGSRYWIMLILSYLFFEYEFIFGVWDTPLIYWSFLFIYRLSDFGIGNALMMILELVLFRIMEIMIYYYFSHFCYWFEILLACGTRRWKFICERWGSLMYLWIYLVFGFLLPYFGWLFIMLELMSAFVARWWDHRSPSAFVALVTVFVTVMLKPRYPNRYT